MKLLRAQAKLHALVINPIIYAEMSLSFSTLEALDDVVLPDFFIGAHAAVEGWPLLTRDASRFKTYFPTLEVMAP